MLGCKANTTAFSARPPRTARRRPSPMRYRQGIQSAIDAHTTRHDDGLTVAMRASGAVRFGPDGLRAQFSAGWGGCVNHEYVRCAVCGHDYPAAMIRRRGTVECGCGMRIQAQASDVRRAPSALALLLLAAAIVLLTAVAALARRLAG